jgi:hypothetical protein
MRNVKNAMTVITITMSEFAELVKNFTNGYFTATLDPTGVSDEIKISRIKEGGKFNFRAFASFLSEYFGVSVYNWELCHDDFLDLYDDETFDMQEEPMVLIFYIGEKAMLNDKIFVVDIDINNEIKNIGYASSKEKGKEMVRIYKEKNPSCYFGPDYIYSAPIDFIECGEKVIQV